MVDDPYVSIIIPVWNGEGRIVATLQSIANQTAPKSCFEVIVVDNGSTDGTAEVVRRFPFVKFLSEPQPGSYRARNLGLAAARGEFVLFTDGDCVADPDWVMQAISATKRLPDVDVYAGHITLFREDKAGPFSARYEELIAFNQEVNVQFGHCVTANWLCRRELLRSIGGFNQDLLSGGDIDCSRRIVAAGYKLLYVPEMTVKHPTRAKLMDLIRKRRRVVGGRWHLEKMKAEKIAGAARMFARESIEQARWTIRGGMEMWAKPGVVAVIVVLMLTAQFELVRLAVGRPAYRS
ncbi:glycosyltransferase [Mesorhizobium ventifaucium]|uniref:Dolichyl-phosphate mannose synthase related protein n=1 Tax=Mesorhizobium ventifaucium TaxID=666020 RepID=A0ABM9DLS0_9HYPH|nr:glycosyltransferase [Mesorhizobium ventifaucium]CAH2397564.1 Dolichyl-phosphate mannose synthase related protein [Mesorhizobium ventifaucium]